MPNNEVNNFRWVYEHYLAGSAYPKNAAQVEWLFYLQGIRTIVSLEPIDDLPEAMFAINSLELRQIDILFPDGEEPTRDQADQFVALVDECLAGNLPLLCHCKAGRGRTGLMLVYYLMTRFGYTLDQGLDAVLNTVQESDQLKFLYDYAQELAGKSSGDQMLSADLISEYNALNLDQSRALITGSGPLAVRGIRSANDIDVLVVDAYYQELLERFSGSEVKPGKMVIGNIDICNGAAGKCDFMDVAMANSQIINNMNFMALSDVVRLKMQRRLPKDFADIVMVKHYLKKTILT